MNRLGLALALALSLAACRGQALSTVTPTLPPPQVVVMTNTPAPASAATVTLRPGSATVAVAPTPAAPVTATQSAPDGVGLATTFYPPVQTGPTANAKAPGVLLLPMVGQSRADWDAFARALQVRGFAVLTVDWRGQGESGGAVDWAKAPADAQAVWQSMLARPEVDAEHAAIVGASIGANLALITGENNPQVATVIALSPGQDYKGVQPVAGLGNFGQRGVLFVASQDDTYAYDSVRQMAPLVPKGETYYFAKAGHGTAMFSETTLAPLLFTWLQDHLGVLKG
jgi:dienelactone hydrolase